jgi:hypothetical protein
MRRIPATSGEEIKERLFSVRGAALQQQQLHRKDAENAEVREEWIDVVAARRKQD